MELFATMFTKEYMETNEEVRKRLVSQLTLPIDSFFELPQVLEITPSRDIIRAALSASPVSIVYLLFKLI